MKTKKNPQKHIRCSTRKKTKQIEYKKFMGARITGIRLEETITYCQSWVNDVFSSLPKGKTYFTTGVQYYYLFVATLYTLFDSLEDIFLELVSRLPIVGPQISMRQNSLRSVVFYLFFALSMYSLFSLFLKLGYVTKSFMFRRKSLSEKKIN